MLTLIYLHETNISEWHKEGGVKLLVVRGAVCKRARQGEAVSCEEKNHTPRLPLQEQSDSLFVP